MNNREYYDFKSGKALIFNHKTYDTRNTERDGTDKDRDDLITILEDLGFDISDTLNSPYLNEIKECLDRTANSDHSQSDCLCVVVMTHGGESSIEARDISYEPELLWSYFTDDKCPSLAGKPKLFIIQACRGNRKDRPVPEYEETDGFSKIEHWPFVSQSDLLIVNGSAPGFLSIRHKKHGTWFIQSLCDELRDSGARDDILTLMTSVFQKVARKIDNQQTKQIPVLTSTLTRLLRFNMNNS